MSCRPTVIAAAAGIAGIALAADGVERGWNFDSDIAGRIAKGFTAGEGTWVVTAVDEGKVLAQTAKSSDSTFNVVLIDETSAKDVDVSVAIVSVAGKIDQGGGIVWRAQDARNYYVARYNPLEDNYRAFSVVDGKRTQLHSADIEHSAGAHTLRVTAHGDHIECYYDGQKYLKFDDATFTKPGKIGLWTKADAETYFDNLKLFGD